MARRRVHGPYRHGQRWRIVVVGEDGTQVADSFGTEDEAEKEKQRVLRSIEANQGLTLTEALDQYEVHLRAKGNKARSIETTRGRIEKLFDGYLDRPLRALNEAACAKAYGSLHGAVAVDTHRNALNEARTFLNWCIAKPRRWLPRNPLAEVKGDGKRKKGKPQLRVDECRKFAAKAVELAGLGDVTGVVGLATLYFGTRITELITRPVRDLDDGGQLLWIPDSKTENGRRFLDVPPDLVPHLVQLAAGKKGDDPLFVGVDRHVAHRMVKRICRLAEVPPVGPHGLRGTHTSIARERGATPHIISAAVGHGSYEGVTAQHYVAPGVEERAKQRAMMKVLEGGKR